MKLEDLIIFLPGALIGNVAKSIKTRIPEQTKEYIEHKHLYHCTLKKEKLEKIIETGYLKPATGIKKNINSYGKAACFMFAGMPSIDSFIRNMTANPYIEPDRIFYAVEIDVKKEELNNYKIRPLADEAVLYEGYSVLPNERFRAIEMVADLKRDDNGNPIINPYTGKPLGVEFRERTQTEIEQNPDKYIPKQDYMNFINEKKKEYGFSRREGILSRKYNNASNWVSMGNLEYKGTVQNTKRNLFTVIKAITNRLKKTNKMLDENPSTKIETTIKEKSFLRRKNPYADKKFAVAIAEFQKQGLLQIDLYKFLPEFVNSKDGMFLRDKYNQIDRSPIKENGIHGVKHNNRVAMLALMIGQGEGILKEESTRERELLTTAAYYHDIGRIADIGPHAKRSARLIKKIDLDYLDGKNFSNEDKRIVQLLAEGHEGKDNKIHKLIKKYNIQEENVEMVTKLMSVLKDADALDRSRLTINTPILTVTDLEPKYLRLNTSKRLMEASYGLESLTQKVNITDIQNYKNENPKEHYYQKVKKIDEIKVNQEVKEKIESTRQMSIQDQSENQITDSNEERED